MYDWEALWRDNLATITPLSAGRLPDILGRARLIEEARAPGHLAVYETEDCFLLIRHDRQPLMCPVDKRSLFDITLRLVDEEDGCEIPAVEWMVDNLATGESGAWRGDLSLDAQGMVRIAGHSPGRDPLPDMDFGPLSFVTLPAFRAELMRLWREDLSELAPSLAAELRQGPRNTDPEEDGETARLKTVYERYAMMVRHEQAWLARRFSETELRLIAGTIRHADFSDARSCRGLWLAVESWLVDNDHTLPDGIDPDDLLARMKSLSYGQEVALIEALAPVDA
ncbi:hypothetical protein [Paludibacterium paludis]|uniref:Uncharacterized protein n=1 Tax=Paludibacterium paludis TaxID=1225769 RepID=A0A918UBV9_9NEIS|nr:hypothetical protein [Paludibacterium paludis]GGY25359.1 hypothetical protein GCM10011289_31190 [Paludibacterium paludis]